MSETGEIQRWEGGGAVIFILRCPVCQTTAERRGRDCMEQVHCPQCHKPMTIAAYQLDSGRVR